MRLLLLLMLLLLLPDAAPFSNAKRLERRGLGAEADEAGRLDRYEQTKRAGLTDKLQYTLMAIGSRRSGPA